MSARRPRIDPPIDARRPGVLDSAGHSAVRALRLDWTPVDALIVAGWRLAQIVGMADGKERAPALARWRALENYLGAEAKHAARNGHDRMSTPHAVPDQLA